MSFELNFFGSAVDFGKFDFFDLMDANPGAVKSADVVAFQPATVAVQDNAPLEGANAPVEGALPTAA